MASEILGLFTNPQQYLAAQDAAMQQQFAQRANLAPLQKASILAQQAGYRLGQGVGGALGGEDPQLKMISQRQALSNQLDPSDPASYMRVAQAAAQIGDQQFAMAIAQEGRKAQSEMALAKQRGAEKMTNEQRNALEYASQFGTPDTQAFKDAFKERFDQLTLKAGQANKPFEFEAREARLQDLKAALRVQQNQTTPNPEAIQRLKDSIQAIEGVEKPPSTPSVGGDREAIAKELFFKPFSELTQEQIKAVNARLGQERADQAPKIVLPGQPVEPKDWLKFSEYISKDPVMDRTSTIISDAPTAIETIRTSTQNSFSAASLPAAIAKLTGEGKNMSNQDIARYARTGGLTDRLSQDVVGFFTGKKTDVTKQQAEQFAVALYRGALIERKKFIEDQAAQLGYDKSPNYQTSIQQLDKKLSQFSLVNPQGGKTPVPTAKSSDDDLINKYLKPKP